MELAANNAESSATGFTPFYLNIGQDPLVPTTLMGTKIPAMNQMVTNTMDRMREALVDATTNLTMAQEWTKRQVNRSRRSETFEVGDEVVLTTKRLRTYAPHLPMKLKRRWVEPFKITWVISPVACELDLPPQCQVHPLFHGAKLKCYYRSNEFLREVESPPPELV